MDLAARIQQSKARVAAAKATLNDDDRAELEQRDELERLEAEAEEEKQKARRLDVERRLDAAKTVLGENAPIVPVLIKGFDDSFLVQRDNKAHQKWITMTQNSASNPNIDRGALARAYAVAVVYDWNGVVGGDDPEFTLKLTKHLTEFSGMVLPITNAAVDLSGAAAIERKS